MKRQHALSKEISSPSAMVSIWSDYENQGARSSCGGFLGQNLLSLVSVLTLLCAGVLASTRRPTPRFHCCRKGGASWQNQF